MIDCFVENRKLLLEGMTRVAEAKGEKIIEKVIPFIDNGVPEFLDRLNKFEKYSRNLVIAEIKSYH